MSVDLTHGNLLAAPVQAVVNPVNCSGVFGKGISSHFRQVYPDLQPSYLRICRQGDLECGKLYPWATHAPKNAIQWVVNLPVCEGLRDPARLDYWISGMQTLALWVREQKVPDLAIPAVVGDDFVLGDLEGEVYAIFADHPCRVLLYLPRPEEDDGVDRRWFTPVRRWK